MSQTQPSSPNAPRTKQGALQWLQYKGWKLLLIILLVVIITHGLVLLTYMQRYASDLRMLKAQELPTSAAELAGKPVPDSQNGAILYAKAFKLFESKQAIKDAKTLENMMADERAVITGKKVIPIPWAEVKQAAERLSGVVPIAKEAVLRPRCRFPIDWAEGSNITFYDWSKLRTLMKVISAEAVYYAREHRQKEAFDTICLSYRVAQTAIEDNPSTTMCMLVTLGYNNIANDYLQIVMRYVKPDRTQVMNLLKLFRDTNYKNKIRYAMMGDIVTNIADFDRDRLHNGGIPWSYKLELANYFGGLCSEGPFDQCSWKSRLKCRVLGYVGLPLFYADASMAIHLVEASLDVVKQSPHISVEQQQIALTNLSINIPEYANMTRFSYSNYGQTVITIAYTRTRSALSRILLASWQYRASHGQYPETMAQVRSVGLADIPMDPFNGKDFVYKRTAKGFTVYSVGEDFKDDGGRQTKYGADRAKGGDCVLNWER